MGGLNFGGQLGSDGLVIVTFNTMKAEVARRLFSFTDKEIHILVSVVLAVFVLKIAKRTCKSGTA